VPRCNKNKKSEVKNTGKNLVLMGSGGGETSTEREGAGTKGQKAGLMDNRNPEKKTRASLAPVSKQKTRKEFEIDYQQ